jgi:hypothetical protein
MSSKAMKIGEALRALAYKDFEILDGLVGIHEYEHAEVRDEKNIRIAVDKQTERHVLHHISQPVNETVILDDWCFECTREFLLKQFGSFSVTVLNWGQELLLEDKLASKQEVSKLVIAIHRCLEDLHEEDMRGATKAVVARENLSLENGDQLECLLRQWNHDDDRVTDFYLEFLGKRFEGMIDRAERLSSLTVRVQAPPDVQRYLTEASRCFIFGQYLACLVVCRAAIEFALGDFLQRIGKGPEINKLQERNEDGLWGRISIARSLKQWNLSITLDTAWQVAKSANIVLHEKEINSEKCKELFFRARGVLRDLYS